ncbi:MAG: hypothetical protein ABH840_02480 [Nanoarchaeota archaeon]
MTSMTTAAQERVIQRFEKDLVLWSGKHFFKTHDYGYGNFSGVSLPFFQVLEVGDSPLTVIENNNQTKVIKAEKDTRSLSEVYWEPHETKAIGYKSVSFILIPELEHPKLPEMNDWKGLLKFLGVGWFSPRFYPSRKRFNVHSRYKEGISAIHGGKEVSSVKEDELNDRFYKWLGRGEFSDYCTFGSGGGLIGRMNPSRVFVLNLPSLISSETESAR